MTAYKARHAKPFPLTAGNCPVCLHPVDIAEAMVMRADETADDPPTHRACYDAMVLVPERAVW